MGGNTGSFKITATVTRCPNPFFERVIMNKIRDVVDYRDKLLLPLIGDVLNIYSFEGRNLVVNKSVMKLFKKEETLYGG